MSSRHTRRGNAAELRTLVALWPTRSRATLCALKTFPLALLALAPALSAAARAEDRSCRAKPVPPPIEGRASAVDGDTLAFAPSAVVGTGAVTRIRLWGVQAPEPRDKQTGQETVAGMVARSALADRLSGPIRCEPGKWDRYCRLVATCSRRRQPRP